MRYYLSIVLVASFLGLVAQSPRVPSKMMLGDIKLKITDRARTDIQKSVNELTKHPKSFNAKVDLANQYFHFIESAFRQEGVPEDIKYLVIQESGLVSDAVSASNAVGYWQFKDFTAVEVGLRVDRHVDERKNIVAASIGAAKYLKKNNEYFDNWIFAIQAYQMGAGAALKSTNKKLYGAKQMTITKKTYWYVKKYLAHRVAYQDAVGKDRPSVYLTEYQSAGGKSLKDIANKYKVDHSQMLAYNKWLKKGKIPRDKKYSVIIPDKQYLNLVATDNQNTPSNVILKKAPSYYRSQAKLFPTIKKWKGSSKYSGSTKNINRLPGIISKSDDRLEALATKGNLPLSKFLELNDIDISHKVTSGQVYYFKKKKAKAKVNYHVVHPEETLWSIAQKYGIRLKKLLMKNRMTTSDKLKVGRVLWVRHIRPENTPITYEEIAEPKQVKVELKKNIDKSPSKIDTVKVEKLDSSQEKLLDTVNFSILTKKIHTVKAKDTYYNISNRYGVEVLQLIKWNNLKLSDKLAIGQQLNIYVPNNKQDISKNLTSTIPSSSIKPKVHIVASGETLYGISRKYNVTVKQLILINKKEDDKVKVGEKLVINSASE